MGATYELADISNEQVTHTLTYIQADKLTKVEEPTSASTASTTISKTPDTVTLKSLTGFDPCIQPTKWDPSIGEKVLYNSDNKEYTIVTIYNEGDVLQPKFTYKIHESISNTEVDKVKKEDLKIVCTDLEKYIAQRFLKNPNEDISNSNEVVQMVLQLDNLIQSCEESVRQTNPSEKSVFTYTQGVFTKYARLMEEPVGAKITEGTFSTISHPSVRHPKLSTKEIKTYLKYWKYKKFIEIFDNRADDADFETNMKNLGIISIGPENYQAVLTQMKTVSTP
jgi:hypothetical protein